MRTKIKTMIICALAVALSLFISIGVTASYVYADEEEIPEQAETVDETNELDALVAQFTDYLKDKYGADYEFYYNQIIEQWGSVEAYLLSFGDKLPEEYQSAWQAFIGWLGEYSVIWAPALAVSIVILVAVIGKKSFNKLVERIVNSKLSPIVKELNLQSNATVSIIHAQKALLGNNERFAENVKELEESERGLKGE